MLGLRGRERLVASEARHRPLGTERRRRRHH